MALRARARGRMLQRTNLLAAGSIFRVIPPARPGYPRGGRGQGRGRARAGPGCAPDQRAAAPGILRNPLCARREEAGPAARKTSGGPLSCSVLRAGRRRRVPKRHRQKRAPMFERNKVDNAPEMSAVPVEITLLDGTRIKGKLLVPVLKTVADALNGSTAFIEFEPYGGEKRYLAKAQLAAVKPVGVPKMPALQSRLRDNGEFDPYAVLGLAHGAAREQIREAYVALAKAYHPDRYANVVLPPRSERLLGRHGAAHQRCARRPGSAGKAQAPYGRSRFSRRPAAKRCRCP